MSIYSRFCPRCGVPMRHMVHGFVCDRCGLFVNHGGKRMSRRQQYVLLLVCVAVIVAVISLGVAG
jgi:ribosomal protein S27AE